MHRNREPCIQFFMVIMASGMVRELHTYVRKLGIIRSIVKPFIMGNFKLTTFLQQQLPHHICQDPG